MPSWKLRRPRRKLLRRRPVRKYRRPARRVGLKSKGFLHAKRRTQDLTVYVQSGQTQGVPNSTNPNMIQFGTPVAVTGANLMFDVPFAMTFRLSDVAQSTEFSSLFEHYQLRNVMIKVSSSVNNYFGGQPVPEIMYITDTDDATVPDPTFFLQRMGIKSKTIGSSGKIWIGCNPRPNLQVWNGSSQPSAAWTSRRPVWLDTDDASIPHFSIKGIIKNWYLPLNPTGENKYPVFRFEPTYDLLFKGID